MMDEIMGRVLQILDDVMVLTQYDSSKLGVQGQVAKKPKQWRKSLRISKHTGETSATISTGQLLLRLVR
jgi:hypothetical protein